MISPSATTTHSVNRDRVMRLGIACGFRYLVVF